MKLATMRSQDPKNRNGELIVVSKDHKRALRPDPSRCRTLLEATEMWHELKPYLETCYQALNSGKAERAFSLNLKDCVAPLPNSPGFYDGSAFLSHVYRARKARGDEMPASAKVTPLMYQGVSDNLLPYYDPIDLMDPGFGGDFEGELGVITTDVPKGTPAPDVSKHIILFTLFNDITYRVLVKTELETKFGFLQSKPNSSFAPIVTTADEFGDCWDGKRVRADLVVKLNGEFFGNPNASEMHFSFPELVVHACRTRPLSAGSIVGSGTISNEDKSKGFACLTEKRFQEILDDQKASTPWLKKGDRVTMEMFDAQGHSLFGCIDQVAK